MAVGDRDAVLRGPTAVSVHDDRDRVCDLGKVLLGADVGAGAWDGGHPG
jgi:hypothetical protein